jgi:hypothetical protein
MRHRHVARLEYILIAFQNTHYTQTIPNKDPKRVKACDISSLNDELQLVLLVEES